MQTVLSAMSMTRRWCGLAVWRV